MAFLEVLLLFSLVLLLIFLYGKHRLSYWSRKHVPQLNPNIIFGDYKSFFFGTKSIQEYFWNIYKENKPKGYKHVGIYNFWKPEYVPLDFNVMKLIMTKDFEYFDGHGVYNHKDDLLSENLFSLDGQKWKERRVKMTPTFTTGKMKMMFDILLQKANILDTILDQAAKTTHEIAIKEVLARFSTDIIASIAFGLDCNTLEGSNHKFREIGREAVKPTLLGFLLETRFSKNLLHKFGYKKYPKYIRDYFSQIVKETIEYRKTSNTQRKDFIQLLLQLKNNDKITTDDGLKSHSNNELSENDVINEAFIFYLAGFETSSTTMTFTLLELAQQPHLQDILRKEINETLAKHDGKLTYESLLEMEYLDKVVKESLRMYPALAVLPRKCSKTYKVPGTDVIIEKDTIVHIPIMGLQRDSEFYPNPNQFNPENFSAENKAKRPDYTWMPFGEGPRQCIGMRFGMMQSKLGIVTALKNYKLLLHEKTKFPLEYEPGSLVIVTKQDVVMKITKV